MNFVKVMKVYQPTTRQVSNHQTRTNIERRLFQNGSFVWRHINWVWHHTTRTTEVGEHILDSVEPSHRISTKCLGNEVALSKSVMHDSTTLILFLKVHELLPIYLEMCLLLIISFKNRGYMIEISKKNFFFTCWHTLQTA